MKHLILTLLLALPLGCWAQIPDEEDIINKTIDSSSPYYYNSLMMRYNQLDSLSTEDYHYLYYGYAYQEDYKPTMTNTAYDELYASLPTINTLNPSQEEAEHVIRVCTEAMAKDPFNPTLLNMMTFAYGALGDSERERGYYNHLQGILQTIKSSGDGRSEKYPMHIIMFSHAIDVVSSLKLESLRPRIISKDVEFVPLVESIKAPDDGKKIKGFYFDYSRIYRVKPDSVSFKRERTWQFNNLKPREYK